MEEIRNYLEAMFARLPNTPQVARAKNELWQMMEDKYTELRESGVSDQEAVATVISEFGRLDELADELGIRDYVSAGTGAAATVKTKKSSNTWIVVLVVLVTVGVLLVCGSILLPMVYMARKAGDAGRFLGYLAGEAWPGETVSDTLPIEGATQIEIDTKTVDLEIVRGEEYKISYECPEKYRPIIEEKDGLLTVKQTGRSTRNCKGEITITVPEETVLEGLYIESEVGDVDIDSIVAADFSISQYVGDVDITWCEFTKADIEENVGDIDIENTTFGETRVANNIGNIKCKKGTFTEIEITNNIGDITLSCQEGLYDVEAKSSIGEVSVNGKGEGRKYSDNSGSTKIRLYNSVGNVELWTNE